MRLILPLLALFPLKASLAQAPIKLNAPLPAQPGAEVTGYVVTRDGATVLYATIDSSSDLHQLYSVPWDLSAPRVAIAGVPDGLSSISQLTLTSTEDRALWSTLVPGFRSINSAPIDGSAAPIVLNQGIHADNFFPHPDGTRVLFSANNQHYIVPTDGSAAPIMVGAPNITNRFGFPRFTTDGLFVVLEVTTSNGPEIHKVSLVTPGSWTNLLSTVPAATFKGDLELSGDEQRVVFRMGQGLNFVSLYSAPMDGNGPVVELNPPLDLAAEEVTRFEISPVGDLVVFRSNHENFNKYQLYSAPSDGSVAANRLNQGLPPTGDVNDFTVSPTGNRVAYIADLSSNGVFDLFTVRTAGGGIRQLNSPYAPHGDTTSFEFSPDGQRVAFVADASIDGDFELFIAIADQNQASLSLSQTSRLLGFDALDNFQFGPNSDIFFVSDSPTARGMYHSPTDGSSAPVRLSDPAVDGHGVMGDFHISLDGSRVTYLSDGDSPNFSELFGAPADASGAHRVSLLPTVVLGDVSEFRVSPDSQWIVYQADQESPNDEELFVVHRDGGVPKKLTNNAVWFREFEISHHGQWVFYEGYESAQGSGTGGINLYRVPIDGSSPSVRVNLEMGPTESIRDWSLHGDNVVFMAPRFSLGSKSLYSAPIDLSAAPQKLNDQEVSDGFVYDYQVDSTNSHVIYRGNLVLAHKTWLYSRPIDGSGVSVRLHPEIDDPNTLGNFALSPDGAHVVFFGDFLTTGVDQVFVVPIAGGPMTLVSHDQGPDGDARFIDFSANSSRVVYYGASPPNFNFELHAADLDGSNHAQITPTLPAVHAVSWSIIGPNGKVIFRADHDVDSMDELYVTHDSGSMAPIKLSPPMQPDGDVRNFELDQHRERVFFHADDLVDGRVELLSSRLDGLGVPRRLSPPIPPLSFPDFPTDYFHGAPVFLWGNLISAQRQVYVHQIRNVTPATRLNPPLPAFGDVTSFRITPDQSRLVYVASGDAPSTYELYIRDLSPQLLQQP